MKDYLEKYIISILLENEMSFDQELLGKSQEHFHKLDFIIKSAVYVYLFIINFLAIILTHKTNISNSRLK